MPQQNENCKFEDKDTCIPSVELVETLKAVKAKAECVLDEAALTQVLDRIAQEVTDDLGQEVPVVLCVMNGGLPLVGALMSRWSFLLELDYLHASRYQGNTQGSELHWLARPRIDLRNRTVLIVDDIYDEGDTLSAVIDWCQEAGARAVKSCVLVEKMHSRKSRATHRPDYIGVQIEDKYLFGCGMDYKGFFRNLMAIYAIDLNK